MSLGPLRLGGKREWGGKDVEWMLAMRNPQVLVGGEELVRAKLVMEYGTWEKGLEKWGQEVVEEAVRRAAWDLVRGMEGEGPLKRRD